MKITIKKLEKVHTLAQLESLGIGNVIVDIGHRGGGVGFTSSAIEKITGVDSFYLPRNFGSYCNYLGGGVRGAIMPSTFSSDIQGKKAELLRALAAACVRVYENLENENTSLNDEEYEDGDINWDAKATKAARRARIESAY